MRLGGGRYGGGRGERCNPLLALGVSVVVSVVLGILHNHWRSQNRPDPLTAGVAVASSPFSSGTARMQAGVFSNWDAFFARKDLSRDNARLSAEVSRLRLENEALRGKAEDTERLRRLLKFVNVQAHPPLPASVTGWLPSPHYETILIGRGTRDGVQMQSIVRTPDGLVGVVDDVSAFSASVRLLSDTESQVHGVLYRNGKRLTVMGAVQGMGRGLALQMRNLRREDEIKPGDIVVTTGFGGVYPPGIPIGKVSQVTEDTAHFLKNAEVKSFASLPDDLREVLVLP